MNALLRRLPVAGGLFFAAAVSAAQGQPAPGVSTIESCSEATAWAARGVHDCEWAGRLLEAERNLRGVCDMKEQTTQLREARLILTSCGAIPPEDMQAPAVQRDYLNLFNW